MRKLKSEFIKEINKLAADFFSISVRDENRSNHRETLKGKLWVKLWNYYKQQYSKIEKSGYPVYETFSGVINETIGKCCLNYDLSRGIPFINYVNSAVKKEINSTREKNNLHGLKVPKEIKQLWSQIQKIAEQKGLTNDNDILKACILIGKDEQKIKEALKFGKIKNSSFSETIKNSDGEQNSIFDLCKSEIENPEEIFNNQIDFNEIINKFEIIDACFLKTQKRTQKYLSALLTHKLYTSIKVCELKTKKIMNCSFINRKMLVEFYSYEEKGSRIPSQQEVAKQFGKNKTDASRTLKNFFEKVKKIIFYF